MNISNIPAFRAAGAASSVSAGATARPGRTAAIAPGGIAWILGLACALAGPESTVAAPDPGFPLPDTAVVVSPDPAAETAPESSVENLRIAYYVDAWDRTERRQIHAMLDSWAPGFTTPQFRKCEFQVFDGEEALAAAVRLGKFDAVCVYAFQMPTLGRSLELEPGLLIGSANALQSSLVLLVGRDSGIDSLSALEGKKIFLDSGNIGALPALWLLQAAKAAGATLGRAGSEPAQLGLCADSFNAIAPVFFGTADACVITQQGFTENAGLNPQVLQQLHVLAKSPPYISRVLAFPPGVDRSKKSAFLARRPSLKGNFQSSGFLSAQNPVFYDVAEGDFAPYKDFDPAELPLMPEITITGHPSLTRVSDDSPGPADPD